LIARRKGEVNHYEHVRREQPYITGRWKRTLWVWS